jgi:hypothetical protein
MEKEINLKRKKIETTNVPSAWLSEYHWMGTEGDLMYCILCRGQNINVDWSRGVLYHAEFKKTRCDEHGRSVKHGLAVKQKADAVRALQFFSGRPSTKDEAMLQI